jgi:hypothetical protein
MKKRKPKPDDQENADKAANLIAELVKLNPQIEPSIWVSACLTSVARAFRSSDYTYEEFIREAERALKFYKRYWEQA